jgi:predicted SAM-dependent methyltransferase
MKTSEPPGSLKGARGRPPIERFARRVKATGRRAMGHLTRRGAIQSYLRSHPVRKLQLGSGSNPLEEWLNTDIRPRRRERVLLDASRPFPIEDETFDYVFGEHVIEHLTFPEGLSMLRQCHRILRPRGRIRIATPNLERVAGLFVDPKTAVQRAYIEYVTDHYIGKSTGYRASFVINGHFSIFGHRFLYDPETLEMAAREVGFDQCSWWEPGESDDPNLAGLESHGRIVGEEINRFETLVMEAVRP